MKEIANTSSKKNDVKTDNSVLRANKVESFQSRHSPADHVLHLQRTIGNRAVGRLIESGALQTKLKIGQPGDRYEQEADRVAEAVMRMPEPGVQKQPIKEEDEGQIKTKPVIEQITPFVQRQVEEEDEEELLQTKGLHSQSHEIKPGLTTRIQSMKGGGHPLPESTRSFFEPRFGHDFSQVRLHTDTRAAETAQAVNARAFTVGNDVVFGAGEYVPGTVEKRHLLAHELMHVVQQGLDIQIIQRSPSEPKNIYQKFLEYKKKYKGRPHKRKSFSVYRKLYGPSAMREHHLIPQEINKWRRYRGFARRLNNMGVNIDRYIVNIPVTLHDELHKGPRGGVWNKEMIQFFRKNPNFTRNELETKIKELMKKYNIPKSARGTRAYRRKPLSGKTVKQRRENPPKQKPKKIELPKYKVMKEERRKGRKPKKPVIKKPKPVIKKPKPVIKMEKAILKGLKVFGRTGLKVLGGYIALGPLFEVTDALAQFENAKAQIDEIKRIEDEAWAKYDMEYGELTDTKETPAETPYRHSIRVYDISKFRLTAKETKVSEDALGISYHKISFRSLTDLNNYIFNIASSQFDCQKVLRTGLSGIQQFYQFKGYVKQGNYWKLKKLLQNQMSLIPLSCAFKILSEGTLESEEEPLMPDSDSEYDWLKQDIEQISDDWKILVNLNNRLHNVIERTEEYELINDEFKMSFDFFKEDLNTTLDRLTFIINTANLNPDFLEELKMEKEFLDDINYMLHNEI